MPVDQHILTEKSKNKTTATEQSTASASELAKLNSKMDMIMKTLVLMDKRLTLVEDQLRKQDESGWKYENKNDFLLPNELDSAVDSFLNLGVFVVIANSDKKKSGYALFWTP